ncbi:MAG: hypothetical protein U5L10_03870 [Candidatus Moranbacteria bacterium]|nr:hypothetical protein [Candidatus Moranbacteria bacterium]
MKKIILLLFIMGSLFVVNTAIVTACSCVQPASPQESLEQSTAVFAGKVIDVDVPSGLVVSSADPVKVTFEVSKIWKGPDYKTLVLTTARDEASCGYSFKENEEYIVYAYGEEDTLSTDICSRTKPLANAEEDLQDLGTGNSPTNPSSNYVQQTSNFILIASIAGIAIVLFFITIFLIRKYKK